MYEIIIFFHFYFIILSSAFNCTLPNGCEINDVNLMNSVLGNEKLSTIISGILCDVRDEKFQFTFPNSSLLKPKSCVINDLFNDVIEFRFHSNFILSEHLNFTNILRYSLYLNKQLTVNIIKLKGFELDTKYHLVQGVRISSIVSFNFIKCNMEFYSNGRLVKTCQEIIDSYQNIDSIWSVFQFKFLTGSLIDPLFRTPLCPLLFKNLKAQQLAITGLSYTFYKRNILTFENRTFDNLNSSILVLTLNKIQNINIDGSLLNPSIFQKLAVISLSGSVNMIDGRSLNALKNIGNIIIAKYNYRDMIHKNGIKWIRDLNPDLDVNFNNFEKLVLTFFVKLKIITIQNVGGQAEIRLSKLFPEKDFCLYKDFPFKQLVILTEVLRYRIVNESLTNRYTCTYLWLAKYFPKYIKAYNR